ncbi:hypothetical protein DERF_005068 [Dermatophagoides farinae]|uniref:Uncharacterized protein n=1 Tax=Dermatophagoides farinae TaxID=6954 RepID=A0A922I673_DERFA|nr:hypothetical protein DERF_005068 [Dermatophagoides farinae]
MLVLWWAAGCRPLCYSIIFELDTYLFFATFVVHLNLTNCFPESKVYLNLTIISRVLRVMNCLDMATMIIGGQIPGRTIEQNLTSEARDGFAMVPEKCLSSKTSRASANGQSRHSIHTWDNK